VTKGLKKNPKRNKLISRTRRLRASDDGGRDYVTAESAVLCHLCLDMCRLFAAMDDGVDGRDVVKMAAVVDRMA